MQIVVTVEDKHRKVLDMLCPNRYGFDLFVKELKEIKCLNPDYIPATGLLFIEVPFHESTRERVDILETYLNGLVDQI